MPRDLPEGMKIVLHVGCGPNDGRRLHERFKSPEWHELRLDINPRMEPDIVASMLDMEPVPSRSVDAVYSSHNLEHVFAHEVSTALAEFLRVLRPGGGVLVTMPDLQSIADRIARGRLEDPMYETPTGLSIAPLDVLYGHGAAIAVGNEFMAHRTGFTARTLTHRLQAAGFCDVEVRRGGNDYALWGTAKRPA
jgi:SAM-dependent methyltransferase